MIHDAITYIERNRRKMMTAIDVVYAFKRQGRTFLLALQDGFDKNSGCLWNFLRFGYFVDCFGLEKFWDLE